jgi:ubiquitin-protein ligase
LRQLWDQNFLVTMNPRMRRLAADADAIRTEFAGHPEISVTALGPEPAEIYQVQYRLRGATLDASGHPVIANEHRVVIQLPASYPREKPIAMTESLVFHPNFGSRTGDEICIGDFWTPTRTLTDIIVAIGEMLQYQRYNTKSPLNAVAARWTAENEAIFPLGQVQLYQSEPTIVIGGAGGANMSGALQVAVVSGLGEGSPDTGYGSGADDGNGPEQPAAE